MAFELGFPAAQGGVRAGRVGGAGGAQPQTGGQDTGPFPNMPDVPSKSDEWPKKVTSQALLGHVCRHTDHVPSPQGARTEVQPLGGKDQLHALRPRAPSPFLRGSPRP